MKGKSAILFTLALSCYSLSGCAPVTVMSGTVAAGRSAAEERRMGEIVDDIVIKNKIRAGLSKKSFGLFTRVTVNCNEGNVLLTGSVENMDSSAQAAKIAWEVPGVRSIINEIHVENISFATKTKDTWIATRIRTKLLLAKDIKSVNYTVDVNNGIVYLTGIAQNEQELSRAEKLASLVGGVRKVVSYVVLKNDPRRKEQWS